MRREHNIAWKPGDLALCRRGGLWVSDGEVLQISEGPDAGEVTQVRRVWHDPDNQCCGLGLTFEEYPGDEKQDAFDSCEFVKIGDGAALEQARKIEEREPEYAVAD